MRAAGGGLRRALLVVPCLLVAATPEPAAGAPQETQADLPMDYGCLVCHAEKRRTFNLGVHSERGVRCHECHGGDPSALETPAAHRGDFIGVPTKVQTVEICSRCHADPDRMRQYGLPADQLSELRTSRHGMLLLSAEDTNAPTCSDCHNAHATLRADDARSAVYPTNILETCGECHRDERMMEPYGIPADQTDLYRSSAHGRALHDELNFAAPSCIGCHGSHAALPPQVDEVTNVCGRCHVNVRRSFLGGPHGNAVAEGSMDGCTACHSNHGTERVPLAALAATCRDCHEAESAEATLGGEIQSILQEAEQDRADAARAIRELRERGRPVADVRFRYRTALTSYGQLLAAAHGLDLERMRDLARRAGSISRDIRGSAEVAAEERWEHKLILVPVWFLALSTCVLVGFRLRRPG